MLVVGVSEGVKGFHPLPFPSLEGIVRRFAIPDYRYDQLHVICETNQQHELGSQVTLTGC
jgi:hypothetical protein